MRRVIVAVLMFVAVVATVDRLQAAPLRLASIMIDGQVQDVVTIKVQSTDLSGGSMFSATYLDIQISSASPAQIVRLRCYRYVSECLALSKGEAIHVTAVFDGLRNGFDPSPTFLTLDSIRQQ